MASLTSRGLRGGLMWAREPRFLLPLAPSPSLQPWTAREETGATPVSALVSSRRLVFLGEQHGEREVVQMELAVLETMLRGLVDKEVKEAKLKVGRKAGSEVLVRVVIDRAR